MRKYWVMYKQAVQRMFVEAGGTFIWILVGATETFVLAFTWSIAAAGKDKIGTLATSQVITYYFFMFIAWYIIGGIFHHMIVESINNGNLANWLVKPVFPYARFIMIEQGWKTFGLVSGIPLLIIFFIIFSKNITLDFDLGHILASIPAIILGTLLFGEFEFIIASCAFWTQSVYGIRRIYEFLYNIFGGYLVPLLLLPTVVQDISRVLPFRYIFAFAIELFQGQLQTQQALTGYLLQIIWVGALALLCKFLYQRGLTKYESFGN